MSLDPSRKEEREQKAKEAIRDYDDMFGSLDYEKSYFAMFELLWYAQMPCTDVKGLTSETKDGLSSVSYTHLTLPTKA